MTEWAETAGLNAAINASRMVNERYGDGSPEGDFHKASLPTPMEAHPIVVTDDQIRTIPPCPFSGVEMRTWLNDIHLPFPITWIGIDKPVPLTTDEDSGVSEKVRRTSQLRGWLVMTDEHTNRFFIFPFIDSVDTNYPVAFGYVSVERDKTEDSWEVSLSPPFSHQMDGISEQALKDTEEGMTELLALSAFTCCDFLYFLESANVGIEQREVTRQVRRQAERKGKTIASEVIIRRGTRTPSIPRGDSANYTHQFEVRGHYKHHFEFKPDGEPNKRFAMISDAHPERVIQVGGKPCIRIWCPPFVKGPTDKPLVLKTRRMVD